MRFTSFTFTRFTITALLCIIRRAALLLSHLPVQTNASTSVLVRFLAIATWLCPKIETGCLYSGHKISSGHSFGGSSDAITQKSVGDFRPWPNQAPDAKPPSHAGWQSGVFIGGLRHPRRSARPVQAENIHRSRVCVGGGVSLVPRASHRLSSCGLARQSTEGFRPREPRSKKAPPLSSMLENLASISPHVFLGAFSSQPNQP
jgi:hypothetical protein